MLAVSVFVHHAYLTREATSAGVWGVPDSAFIQLLGLGAVAIFFMITAYLFWSRALATGGRLAALPLYRARLRRIFPAYAGSIVVLLFVVACETRFQFRETPGTVALEIARQFSLGIANGAVVDGRPHANIIDAGVTWSLGFECGFYLALPLLALAIRGSRTWLAWLAVALAAALFARHCWIVACFLPGMFAAEAATRPPLAGWFARFGNTLVLAGCALLGLAVVALPHAYLTLEHGPRFDVAPQLVALCAIFAGVSLGPGPKLLRRSEFVYLGAISYSVYLLHGIVLYVAAHLVSVVRPVATLPASTYWLALAVVCVPAVVVLATCSYFGLEAPFLRAPAKRARAA